MIWLWFDVERQYKTIVIAASRTVSESWFDVERQYKTMHGTLDSVDGELWFDVERQYKTIQSGVVMPITCCGLM